MRALKILLSAVLFATLLIAFPAAAQKCTTTDTVLQCWERFNPATPEEAADRVEDTVAAANTGVPTLTSPAGSALKDLLTLLSGSLESSSFDDTAQGFSFQWNPKGKILGKSLPVHFEATFRDAAPSARLTELLATNADALKALDSSLQPTDDIALSATVDHKNKYLGRSIAPHRTLFQNWLDGLTTSGDRAARADAFAKAIEATTLNGGGATLTTPQAVAAMEGGARLFRTSRVNVTDFTEAFTKLLNNQAQFYASATYDARRNIVGPNQWAGTVTFEWGASNLSSFQRKNADCREDTVADNAAKCLDALKTFAADAATDRLSVAVDFNRTNRRWIDLPDQNVEYGIPRARTVVGSLTYGRPFGNPTAASGTRLDVKLEYEDNSDKDIDNRLIGSAILTYKINDGFSVPLGFVFANHEKDLPDSDRQVSAHFGLVYKLPDLNVLGLGN
ncbi:MAG TPA: hypothetical protein VEK57_31810 [Thermoanaerobaculia bacterium]|nr:hypothetical protein [Thermoanaerobaculia bacterium]